MEMYLRIALFICLAVTCICFFLYLQRSNIIWRKLKEAYQILDESAVERVRKRQQDLIHQDEKAKSFLEKVIEKPSRRFTYSGLGRKIPGLTVEIWLVLLLASAAAIYFAVNLLTESVWKGLMSSGVFLSVIYMLQTAMAWKNYRVVEENLLKLFNMIGNFGMVSGEITSVFLQVSRYMPYPLGDALEECYYDAQTSGDISAALYALSAKIEHPKFKEAIRNIEVSTNYTDNYRGVIDTSRKVFMDEQRARRERKAIASASFVNMFIISLLLLVALFITDQLIDRPSVWQILFHTSLGGIVLGVVGAIYVFFAWCVLTTER